MIGVSRKIRLGNDRFRKQTNIGKLTLCWYDTLKAQINIIIVINTSETSLEEESENDIIDRKSKLLFYWNVHKILRALGDGLKQNNSSVSFLALFTS